MTPLALAVLLALILSAIPHPSGAEGAADPAPAELQISSDVPATPQTGFLPGGDLFGPLIADPRWPHFSIAYQYYIDDPDFRDIGAVSMGGSFPLYRWRAGGGFWEAGIQAGVFAIFDMDTSSFELVNSDYFAALTTAYRSGRFSALGRITHQSSHLGDEFLVRSTSPSRTDVSYNSVDAKLSYDFDAIRLYGGGSYLFYSEPSLKPWSFQAGLELRSPWPGPAARWRPIAAVDFKFLEENNWDADVSVRAGIQLDGVMANRNIQLLVEYFHGHSPNGQFFRQTIDYIGIGAHLHF
jgi:hypothetical protein